MFATDVWHETRILNGCRPRPGEIGGRGVFTAPEPGGLRLAASDSSGRYCVEIFVPGRGDLPAATIPFEMVLATSREREVELEVGTGFELRAGRTVYHSPLMGETHAGVCPPDSWISGDGGNLAAALELAAAGDDDRDQIPFRHVVIGERHAVAGASGGRIAVLGPTVPWLVREFGTVRLPLDRAPWLRGVLARGTRFAANRNALFVAGENFSARIPIWTEATPIDGFASTGLEPITSRLPESLTVPTAELRAGIGSDPTIRIDCRDSEVGLESSSTSDTIAASGSAEFSAVLDAARFRDAIGVLNGETTTIRGTTAAVVLQSGDRSAFLIAQRS